MSLRVAKPLRGWCPEETDSGTMGLVGSDSYNRVLIGAYRARLSSLVPQLVVVSLVKPSAATPLARVASRGRSLWLSRLGEYVENPLRVGAVLERPFGPGVVL
jgi:hypothetical protein